MIKINKFKNVFGISNLIGADSLTKINIVYAPNGTAKTSIADGLELISEEGSPADVYGINGLPSFEIDVDGDLCTETNYTKFNVLKYTGTNEYLLKDADYSALVISSKMQKKVTTIITNIKTYSDNAISLIKNSFPKKSKTKGFIETLTVFSNCPENDFYFAKNLLENLKLSTTARLSVPFKEEEVIDFITYKCKSLCDNDEIKTNSSIYFDAISKTISHEMIDNNFTVENLNIFNSCIEQTHYFDDDGKRTLNINDEKVGKDELKTIVEEINKDLYGSEEALESFENIKKVISKSIKIENVLKNHNEIIGMLSDFDGLARRIFITYLDSKVVVALSGLLAKILVEKKKLDLIKLSIDDSDSKLTPIWNKYKSRFKFEKFDLDIRDKFNAVIGNEVPSFVKLVPGTNIEITDPKAYRFSTGEIKTFYLINFILEVERIRFTGEDCLLILDDAVDSFDYKNKYGLIDYLLDIASDPHLQILVLTHNFDFYRSSTLALSNYNPKNYFANKTKTGDVKFIDTTSNKYFLNVSSFNTWKNSGKFVKYVALIPFYRNLFQLENNSTHPNVLDLDKYLHYDTSTETLDFTIINSRFAPVGCVFPPSMNLSQFYLRELITEGNVIAASPITENELDKKLFLGICLRVFTEKLLYKTIIANGQTVNLTGQNAYSKGRILYNAAEPYLNDEEKKKIIEINVIAPSYAHANSFMYEPLIDVGSDKLIESYNWLISELTSKGY